MTSSVGQHWKTVKFGLADHLMVLMGNHRTPCPPDSQCEQNEHNPKGISSELSSRELISRKHKKKSKKMSRALSSANTVNIFMVRHMSDVPKLHYDA
jgi:hypothetical protein